MSSPSTHSHSTIIRIAITTSALFEIEKIFALIPDYKDSREIERYAKEGKRKLEAQEEEKRKKEAEEKLKLQIAALRGSGQGYDGPEELRRSQSRSFRRFLSWIRTTSKSPIGAVWSIRSTRMNRIKEQEKSVQDQINLQGLGPL